jgi:hypothetical protein
MTEIQSANLGSLSRGSLASWSERISDNYETRTGNVITSNDDFIEGFEIVEEIYEKLESFMSSEAMDYFYHRVTFCQESNWHVDTFSYSVMVIIKSEGRTIETEENEIVVNTGEVVLLRSDISHRLKPNDNDDSFIFVAFDIPRGTEDEYKKALDIFNQLK